LENINPDATEEEAEEAGEDVAMKEEEIT